MNYIQYMQTPFAPILSTDGVRVEVKEPVQSIVHPLSQTKGYLAWAANKTNPSVEDYEKFLQQSSKERPMISQGRESTEEEKRASQQKLELYEQLQKEAADRKKAAEVVVEGLNYISPSYWTNKNGAGLNGTESFLFDVAADPTTYLSMGVLPVAKQVGKKATKEVVEKVAKEGVEKVVKETAEKLAKPALNMSDLLPEERILFQNLKESGYDVSKLTRDQLEDISFSMSDALQGRPEGIIKSGNTYYLVNEDGITGAMQLESLENGAVAPLWVENFSRTGGNPQKGISEKLYSQAIRDNKGGLVSGGLLEDAGATLKVLEKFPNKQVRGNYGQHIFKDGTVRFEQPVYLLTSPSGATKVPSATIDWSTVKDGILPELIWNKQGGKLNYLNYSK